MKSTNKFLLFLELLIYFTPVCFWFWIFIIFYSRGKGAKFLDGITSGRIFESEYIGSAYFFIIFSVAILGLFAIISLWIKILFPEKNYFRR